MNKCRYPNFICMMLICSLLVFIAGSGQFNSFHELHVSQAIVIVDLALAAFVCAITQKEREAELFREATRDSCSRAASVAAVTWNKCCTGCGARHTVVSRRTADLCEFCWDVLKAELDTCKEKHLGPRFSASYWTGTNTLGVGLYISKTPAEAIAEAQREAFRNGWVLLRLDNQRTLKDIYVHEHFAVFFPGSGKKYLPYDVGTYGEIPALIQPE
jgi:hypothetical protein